MSGQYPDFYGELTESEQTGYKPEKLQQASKWRAETMTPKESQPPTDPGSGTGGAGRT